VVAGAVVLEAEGDAALRGAWRLGHADRPFLAGPVAFS